MAHARIAYACAAAILLWGRLATGGRLSIGLPEAPVAPTEAPRRLPRGAMWAVWQAVPLPCRAPRVETRFGLGEAARTPFGSARGYKGFVAKPCSRKCASKQKAVRTPLFRTDLLPAGSTRRLTSHSSLNPAEVLRVACPSTALAFESCHHVSGSAIMLSKPSCRRQVS